ncbi:glycine zipper family protein [Glacieibacterium sp.]|uniref:glycine zipper family protein n=1 Tax=Glacieibacterium sp. TaxID=2860237 RepID=UPI003AFF924F
MYALPKMTLLALVAAGSLTACTTDRYGDQRLNGTGRGALIGAAGGAVVGALTGNVAAGAAIGAAGGAVVGTIQDDNRYEDRDGRRYYYDRNNRDRRYQYNDRRERVYDPY